MQHKIEEVVKFNCTITAHEMAVEYHSNFCIFLVSKPNQ